MRDKLLMFGALSLATKDTAVYSADYLDMGEPETHNTGNDGNIDIVFQPAADFKAVDSMEPFLQDSADGSSWATIATGKLTAKPSALTQITMPMPSSHRRYLRVGATPASTGTFTATTVNAWIELGK